MVDVCLPGTGGMMPLADRYLSCCHITAQGRTLLIDCGEGTQIALQKAGIKLSKLDALLFTHFHADHVVGLPGLLLSLANNAKTSQLSVIGPKGLYAVLSALLIVCPPLPFQIFVYEWEETDQNEFVLGDFAITAHPLSHSAPCFGYRVALNRKPVFNPKKAEALGVPLSLYKTLHAGEAVSVCGKSVTPEMVTDGERKPITVCYMTDTRPAEDLASFAYGADLLICDGMHAEDEMKEKAHERGHMVFSDGAALAKQANAKHLWLTHFSPALKNPGTYDKLAQAVFPETTVAYDGIRITL